MVLAWAQLVALSALNMSLYVPLPSVEPGEQGPTGSPGHVGSLAPLPSAPPARRVGMGSGGHLETLQYQQLLSSTNPPLCHLAGVSSVKFEELVHVL